MEPGSILKLKPARAKAYDVESPYVRVIRLDTRPGYTTPWIIADHLMHVGTCRGSFKPSDFLPGTHPADQYTACPEWMATR